MHRLVALVILATLLAACGPDTADKGEAPPSLDAQVDREGGSKSISCPIAAEPVERPLFFWALPETVPDGYRLAALDEHVAPSVAARVVEVWGRWSQARDRLEAAVAVTAWCATLDLQPVAGNQRLVEVGGVPAILTNFGPSFGIMWQAADGLAFGVSTRGLSEEASLELAASVPAGEHLVDPGLLPPDFEPVFSGVVPREAPAVQRAVLTYAPPDRSDERLLLEIVVGREAVPESGLAGRGTRLVSVGDRQALAREDEVDRRLTVAFQEGVSVDLHSFALPMEELLRVAEGIAEVEAVAWDQAATTIHRALPDPAGLPDGWAALDPGPLASRVRHSQVWTGTELIVWGGDGLLGSVTHDDGAAYHRREGTWRELAAAPISARSGHVAVWTDEEMIVWGGRQPFCLQDGAAYHPSSDQWRPLPEAPISGCALVAASTGKEMVLVTYERSGRAAVSMSAAAYRPGADRWRRLPPPPVALNNASAAWTGEQVIVYGSNLDGNNWAVNEDVGAAYRPADDRWERLPPTDLSPQSRVAAWSGTTLVAADYGMEAAALEDGTWRQLPPVPLDFAECYASMSASRGLVMFSSCARHAFFDPEWGFWTVAVESGPLSGYVEMVGAGEVFLGWSGTHEGRPTEFWEFNPDNMVWGP